MNFGLTMFNAVVMNQIAHHMDHHMDDYTDDHMDLILQFLFKVLK